MYLPMLSFYILRIKCEIPSCVLDEVSPGEFTDRKWNGHFLVSHDQRELGMSKHTREPITGFIARTALLGHP